jgi:hypothetical protein
MWRGAGESTGGPHLTVGEGIGTWVVGWVTYGPYWVAWPGPIIIIIIISFPNEARLVLIQKHPSQARRN